MNRKKTYNLNISNVYRNIMKIFKFYHIYKIITLFGEHINSLQLFYMLRNYSPFYHYNVFL